MWLQLNRLVVVDSDGRVEGIVSLSDILRRLVLSTADESRTGELVDNTHTHTRLTAPFSGTTRVSRYQKGKTNLDFTEARDSEWQWHQLGRICKSAPRSRQITTPAPHHSVFYRPDALPAAQPTASKH